MRLNNIVTKLWVIMTILVLIIIGVAGFAQTRFMEELYYQQQASQMISLSTKIADIAKTEEDPEELDRMVKLIAGLHDANVMILDSRGIVMHCQGLGVSTKNMTMDMNNPHHGMLSMHDLMQLFNGQVIVHKGNNPYFKTDVLSVATPIADPDNKARAVIIHAPLQPLAEQLRHLQMLIIYAAVGGIVLAALLSLVFSRLITKPLIKMNQVALEMAGGNYQNKIKIESHDEIGLLANSLNTLSDRLQEKIRQLEAQEQIRREFVTNVAHEIKTPLTIMQGFTETMLDGLARNEQETTEYLNNILDEITRLKRLVSEVLDLKKMEEGHFDFDQEPCNLKDILERVSIKLAQLMEQKEISLVMNLEKHLPLVTCNSDRMERVFINLMDNAIRHTPAGGKITVHVNSKGHQVHIQIHDTGSGIAPQDLPLIWERFYKGDKSRSRSQGSTGLGLAIVKNILELHNFKFSLHNIKDGVEFCYFLPEAKIEE